MAVSREHLLYPFSVGANGFVVTADQDSDAEIQSCMAVILSWPLGTRETDLEFGLEDQEGLQGGADLDEIRQALALYEPRAIEQITQDPAALANFVSSVRVGWGLSAGSP